MSTEAIKLTSYFGERHRTGGRFTADALIDLYGRHEIAASILLRGTEGFGLKHHLRTDRSLTLSEDLPLTTIAVDSRPRIESVLGPTLELNRAGLVTLERARLLDGEAGLTAEAALAPGPVACPGRASSPCTSGARRGSTGSPPSSRSATCCTAAALTGPPRCSAWTARPTAAGNGPGSSAATPRCP